MKTVILAALAAGTLLFSATPAQADELEVSAGIATAYFTDPSFDLVSQRDAFSEFVFSVVWGWDNVPGLRTGLLFQSMPGRLEGRPYDELVLGWGRQQVLGTVGWGTDLWWFRPHLSAGLGYSHQYLRVHVGSEPLRDHAHDLAARGSGGLDFDIPMSWGAVGLNTEVGYQTQTTARFDELRYARDAYDWKYEPDEDPWQRGELDLGTLRTSGVFWSVGLHFRLAL